MMTAKQLYHFQASWSRTLRLSEARKTIQAVMIETADELGIEYSPLAAEMRYTIEGHVFAWSFSYVDCLFKAGMPSLNLLEHTISCVSYAMSILNWADDVVRCRIYPVQVRKIAWRIRQHCLEVSK